MDIKNEKLKVACKNCNKNIVLTFNSQRCPKCHTHFDTDEIHNLFYEYESQLANSTAYKIGNNLESIGAEGQKIGGCLSNIGCIIFLLPIALLLGYLFLTAF